MTNENLLERIASGDETALESLCLNNIGLIRNRAQHIARRYGCIRRTASGAYTEWTSETLSELESVGMLALIECVREGKYDSANAAFTTYVVPFLDGAMRRYLETNFGTLSLDKESMALVRKAQRMYAEGWNIESIATELGTDIVSASRAVQYPVLFLSVYDLTSEEEGNDVYDYICADESTVPPHQLVYKKILIECLHEMFLALPRKDQDILGKCYGVFGYRKESLPEIAMYHMMKESAVEKTKDRALRKLREAYPGSKMQVWKTVNTVMQELTGI